MRVFSSGILRYNITPWVEFVILTLLLVCLTGCDKSEDGSSTSSPVTSSISQAKIDEALDAADKNLQSGQFSKAEAILSVLVEKAPQNVDAREMYGAVLFQQGAKLQKQGFIEQAKSFYKKSYLQYKATTIFRANVAGLHQSAGEMASMAGMQDSALFHYASAEKLEPSVVKYPLYQAQIHLAAARLDEAQAAIERALKIDSTEPFALATLANIQMEKGEVEQSLDTITQAIDFAGPDQALAMRVSAARLYRLAGQQNRSIQLLTTLDDESRADAGVTSEIAASWSDLGEIEKAIEAWKHRFLFSNDWKATIEAARLCLVAGKFEEARFWKTQAQVSNAPTEQIRALLKEIENAEEVAGTGG